MTMDDRKPPPSMQQFDYFAETAHPVSPEVLAERADLPQSLDAQVQAWRRGQRRAAVGVLTATLVLAVSSWFLWGMRDQIAYAFAPARPPLVLGDVAELTPADIPHNAFVELQGITEHRGLSRKTARGLLVPEEYWYFRLLGSRGVFVEVPPDPERYVFATRVRVSGRAVDPRRASTYARLLAEYRDRFGAEHEVARIVQVDARPGEGKGGLVLLVLFLSMVVAVDVWSILGLRRSAKARAGLLR